MFVVRQTNASHVAMDATRLGKREVLFGVLHDRQQACKMPPQVPVSIVKKYSFGGWVPCVGHLGMGVVGYEIAQFLCKHRSVFFDRPFSGDLRFSFVL